MLAGWEGVELTGITTSSDEGGIRAGWVAYCLELLGRTDVAVVAGAARSMTTGARAPLPPGGDRYWPTSVRPRPAPEGESLELLAASVDAGATVVAIGPYTNLARLELSRPGALGGVAVVVMGGWVDPPAPGLPPFGPERDWNVQFDTRAALVVAGAADLTLTTLPVTLGVPLRAADLPALAATGPLGTILARQSAAHALDSKKAALGPAWPGLPDDLCNFHYDPLACAVACGWSGATVRTERLTPVTDGGLLRFERRPDGRPTGVVEDVDAEAFRAVWLAALARAQAPRSG